MASRRDLASLRGTLDVGPVQASGLAEVAAADSIPARVAGKAAEGIAVSGPRPRIPWKSCHPVPILGTIPLVAGAGTFDQPDMYGPKDPYWWDLRNLTLFGFTAGTVTVYKNSTSGTPIAQTSVPGDFTWGAQKLLGPRDRLIFTATGITGTVQYEGQAVEVETDWLPEYLM